MGMHGTDAVMSWMARVADLTDIVAKFQPAAGKRKAGVAFDAGHLEHAFVRDIRAVGGGCGEDDGQYDAGSDHRLNSPICCSMDLITPARCRCKVTDSALPGDAFRALTAVARSAACSRKTVKR